MPQIPYAVHLRVEEAWVAFLRADSALAGLTIVAAGNRDAVVDTPYVFVLCPQATPKMPTGPYYLADVTIAIVTNIDDQTHAQRRALTEKVMSSATRATEYDHFVQAGDEHPYLSLEGWVLRSPRETSSGQQAADMIPITCGVWCASGQTDARAATTD